MHRNYNQEIQKHNYTIGGLITKSAYSLPHYLDGESATNVYNEGIQITILSFFQFSVVNTIQYTYTVTAMARRAVKVTPGGPASRLTFI